jgi:hypothetical protein
MIINIHFFPTSLVIELTLENTEGAIKNGQSRETGNIDKT